MNRLSPATEHTLNLYHLGHIIRKHPNKMLWQGTVSNPQAGKFLGFILGMMGLVAIMLAGFVASSASFSELLKKIAHPLFIIWGIFIPLTLMYFLIPMVDAGASMKYQIYPTHLRLKWGIFRKKLVTIPFTAINTIHHVGYDNRKTSTLLFNTTSPYFVPQYNFKKNDLRPQITFEDVHHGEAVCELLKFLYDYNCK